ncbi:MAG: beta-lactamase [Coxiella sp. DG_40]|nr:MAG: beta-lactamase [Coxiella sp. DG_40]
MKLKFLGTRGYIKSKTQRHRMHSSLMIEYQNKSIIIDCGEDWLHKIHKLNPNAIILTHAHPDHAWGLKEGAPCPVYATLESWDEIKDYPIENKHTVRARKIFKICNISFEAFPVSHSKRCPAVGYRIIAGKKVIFYVPDVLSIIDRKQALSNIQLYIGDGSSIKRSLVRVIGETLIKVGHAAISTQLGWCQKEGVTNAIFSHCGSEIVEGDERTLRSTINDIARKQGVNAQIAFDGMEIHL